MSKYNSNTIYKGNIIKNINGEKIIIKENIDLIYESKNDSFYPLEHLNYFLDIDLNEKLSDEKRKEYKKILEEGRYDYKFTNFDKLYVDEESIKVSYSNEIKKTKPKG